MATSQPLGLESYVAGPPPEFISVRAEPLSWVVAAYNRISRRAVVGYFKNPKESEEFAAMRLPISDDRDLSGLEVMLIYVAPCKKSDVSVTGQTAEPQWSNEQYLKAVFEDAGIPSQMVKTLYERGSKLVHVNMSTGELQVEDDWQPPEPADMYPADPNKQIRRESHDPPEPNEGRFWHLGEQHRR